MARESTSKSDVMPLGRGGAAEQIIADLHEQILGGKLRPGAKLANERLLAHRYGVSGPTIREAVRGLATIKMVESKHGSGTYVIAEADAMFAVAATSLLQLKKVTLLDVLDLLETLLKEVSIRACARATDNELSSLRRILDELNSVDEKSDEFINHLAKFQESLADASHSILIATVTKFLVKLLLELIREEPAGTRAQVPAKLRIDRQHLVDALVSRDPESAVRYVMAYHEHARNLMGALVRPTSKSRQRIDRACRRIREAR